MKKCNYPHDNKPFGIGFLAIGIIIGLLCISVHSYAELPLQEQFPPIPAADSANNVTSADVIGNKTDTILGESLFGKVKREVGLIVTKTNTCNGDAAQTDNIFTITGTVRILSIWGVCTEATNATDLADNSLAIYDGTATLELTDSAAPTNCSGMLVGDVIFKNGASATVAITYNDTAAGQLADVTTTEVIVSKKTGAATYIQHLFNGDVNTDVDIKWYVRYIPVSDDGAIAAV